MAARALAAAAAARRLAGHGQTGFPLLASCRRGAQVQNHSSNAQAQAEQKQNAGVHDQVEAALNRKKVETVLPEEAAEGGGPEDAWVPDQETGIFVPADEAAVSVSGADNLNYGASTTGGSSSVLDQVVFVRDEDMEDVERPAVDMAGDK